MRSARLRNGDLQGTQTRREGCRIDPKQLGGAALAVDTTIGTLQRLHQIRALPRSPFTVSQNDIWPVGVRGQGRCRWQIRQCDVETESATLRQDDGALDHVFELADVAWPVVLLEPCGVRLFQGGRPRIRSLYGRRLFERQLGRLRDQPVCSRTRVFGERACAESEHFVTRPTMLDVSANRPMCPAASTPCTPFFGLIKPFPLRSG